MDHLEMMIQLFLAAIFGRVVHYVASSAYAPALPVNNFNSPKSLSMSTTTNVYHLSHPVSTSIVAYTSCSWASESDLNSPFISHCSVHQYPDRYTDIRYTTVC